MRSRRCGVALLHHEWQPAKQPADWKDKKPEQQLRFIYREYLDDLSRDFSRQRVLRLERTDGVEPPDAWVEVEGNHRPPAGGDDYFFEAPEDLATLRKTDGGLGLDGNPALTDHGLLWFRGSDDQGGGEG